jgi:beta-galactosidase/beta-glucuronidase
MRIRAASLFVLTIFIISWTAPAQEQISLNNCPWRLAAQAEVKETGAQISSTNYSFGKWYPAAVPGTVLTTLVNNKIYPEPLYGENNRPDKISESLCRTSYWYRTTFTVPASYAGHKVWLNFDGINYAAEVWVNGKYLGTIKGAFTRGVFDLSAVVKPREEAALAVRVNPPPNPGEPIEHTLANGLGKNGGITAIDGPTFLCTIGWDWIPGIRDRNTGIWQKVFLSASGPVLVQEPLVTSDLPLPWLDSAEIKIQATLKNVSDQPQKGLLKGTLGDIAFQQPVEIEPHADKVLSLDPATTPQLKLKNPKLWWPNGYGPQNLYPVHLAFEASGVVSDAKDFNIGIRKITYTVPDSENLTVSVNGVRVVCKGGCWGMDEAMKRIPRERLEAQIRMHQQANYTMIRNWVGQSTSEDFYELCDKYGIMLWDEFFQPNPSDGPNPTDLETYLANCREKIVRFRNHPSIAIWCGRNEGRPPENINNGLQKLMDELEPTRHYQPSSTDGRGVKSGGPYRWRTPQEYYSVDAPFKTEIGSVSIPTLEAVQAMMPQNDWETINDDWVEHDLGRGAQAGDLYPGIVAQRFGDIVNLADFVRKAQLMNYEAFRSMYEGRFSLLFKPTAGVLTWMSNPAQPSFVWQLYSWDLEANSALFAARKACEPVHVMFTEGESVAKGQKVGKGHVLVINNHATSLTGATATATAYAADGSVIQTQSWKVEARASQATDLGSFNAVAKIAKLHFIKLQLRDKAGKLLSDNFYWRGAFNRENDLQALATLPTVKLEAAVKRADFGGKCLLEVTLRNPSGKIALMAHLQLRRQSTGERVLPVFYSDNYVSLIPGESKSITVEASSADLKGDQPLLALDGWNVTVSPTSSDACAVVPNTNAFVASWPATGLPFRYFNAPLERILVNCGGGKWKGKGIEDSGFVGGVAKKEGKISVDVSAVPSVAKGLSFIFSRVGTFAYTFPMKPAASGYKVRMYFAETDANAAAGTRLFNVDINGKPALADFDIFAAAGGNAKAVMKEFPRVVPSKDGNIVISFRPGKTGEPRVSGIEVVPAWE